MNFYPIQTEDNTISLYNFDVGDVYHSKVGAYTEALRKYVIPSGIKDFVEKNKAVKILDVCYGLGYNAKTAASEILKAFPEADIHITALEIDPQVVAFSSIIGCECFENVINETFFEEISKQLDVQQVAEYFVKNSFNLQVQIREKIPKQYNLVMLDDIKAKLHNIYYRTISSRKSIDRKTSNNSLKVDILLNDARKSIINLQNSYDFIFLDPFTPAKFPILWTVEFLKLLYELLEDGGNLTTYSNAAPVRAGLLEAGFFTGQTNPVGKKTTGTIAYKKSELVKNKLSEKESGILKTKAGIPYRDKKLSATSEEILLNREIEQKNSDRISSSKFLKSFN